MRTNLKKTTAPIYTSEGARAAHISVENQLRRSVLACLLWENGFYEDGQSIADRITQLSGQVKPETLAALAIEARHDQHLRHAPLLLLKALVRHGNGSLVSETIKMVVSRADELAELTSLYWDGKNRKMLPAQLRKGLAKAFLKFDEYQLGKYANRPSAVRLRDVLFLSRAKPDTAERADLWKRLVDGQLATPDTWEVELSGGADKKETFERLIREDKLGYLALLRNLRNMVQAGCDLGLVREAILARKGARRVLPFRFIAAARYAPELEPALDQALCAGIDTLPKLSGVTVVMVDVSGSMDVPLSAKSDLTRKDAACALASVINADDLRVFSFANNLMKLPARKGMAGVDAIRNSQNGGTRLFEAVREVNATVDYDRIIVITDEQAHAPNRYGLTSRQDNAFPAPKGKGYMINVATSQNGVGYGPWVHIDGFSENVIRYIVEREASSD